MLVATTGVLPVFLAGAVGVQLRGELHFGEAGLGRALSVAFLVAALLSVLSGPAIAALIGASFVWLGSRSVRAVPAPVNVTSGQNSVR